MDAPQFRNKNVSIKASHGRMNVGLHVWYCELL